jgi:hypothetical protein
MKYSDIRVNAFMTQKENARRRGIEFLFTFEEWWEIWESSGRWEQRGRKSGNYVMARFRDRGAYRVGNVEIVTVEQNIAQYKISPATRRKLSEARIGNTNARGKTWPADAKEPRRKLTKSYKIVR